MIGPETTGGGGEKECSCGREGCIGGWRKKIWTRSSMHKEMHEDRRKKKKRKERKTEKLATGLNSYTYI